jgi:multidrug efflux pump
VSRSSLGVVIFSGIAFATVMTLFVVPAIYQLVARRTGSPGAVAAELERLQTVGATAGRDGA